MMKTLALKLVTLRGEGHLQDLTSAHTGLSFPMTS